MQQEQRGRWLYIPDQEEIPVTFQIGIVGSDGVLLASDRGHTRFGGANTRTTFSSQKLFVTPAETIAYCCAGDDFTQIVADVVTEACRLPRPAYIRTAKEFLLHGVSGAYPKAIETWRGGGSILLAHGVDGQTVELFRIIMHAKDACPMVNLVDNRDFQGDTINAAAFFVERYLPSERYVRMPLERLKLVAAHTIMMASELNPKGIHGLDMAICRPGKPFEMLGADEIAKLVAASKARDSQIADSLGIPRP